MSSRPELQLACECIDDVIYTVRAKRWGRSIVEVPIIRSIYRWGWQAPAGIAALWSMAERGERISVSWQLRNGCVCR